MESAALDKLVPSRHDRLVAVESNDDGSATLYRRDESGAVEAQQEAFLPWLLLADPGLAADLAGVREVRSLAGEQTFSNLVLFEDKAAYAAALKELRKRTGKTPAVAGAPYRVFSDFEQQLLSLAPARLFRGLRFSEVRRLQLDIETRTSPGYDFPNAAREGDEIIIVSLRDSSGWERCLSGPEMSEAQILKEMVRLIGERDPDVIEGHNIFNFDLPYIQTRCKRHRIRLALGRDGSILASRSSRFSAGERTSTYTRFGIYGRHVVDTMHLTQLYDAIHRDLESYSLKAVARYFGVAAPERTYVEGAAITEVYETDPARLREYAMDDVRETDAISRILSPSFFYQTQIIPFTYQNCVTRGTGARIDALLVSLYLDRGHGIPEPQPSRPFQGGLTASLKSGVFENVWHVDVRSLYPSIMVSQAMTPAQDRLGIFNTLLSELRQFRLAAKDAARRAQKPEERDHYQALQSTFKILINSFYGYVGFSMGSFNDYDLAEAVTSTGREILTRMLEFLQSCGATVVELDTDGIYFVPPANVSEAKRMEELVQAELPEGIEVELDSTYKAMFAYKAKNYALLGHDGKLRVTGAALKSRGLEPFQRRYIHELIQLILTGTAADIRRLYERYTTAIENHEFPVRDFATREVLSTPPRVYQEKLAKGQGRRSAAYELAVSSGRDYKQGDQVAFYVTGTNKRVAVTDAAKLLADANPSTRDENIPYYLDKLSKLHGKLAADLPASPLGNDPRQMTLF